MRRATNNKRGRWFDVVYMDKKGKRHEGYTAYGFIRNSEHILLVAFTNQGAHFDPDDNTLTLFSKTPVEPPTWGFNMWDVEADAERAGHYAMLYDARYKTLIEQGCEFTLSREIRERKKTVAFLESLASKEPWK